jgi:hypothetical protein
MAAQPIGPNKKNQSRRSTATHHNVVACAVLALCNILCTGTLNIGIKAAHHNGLHSEAAKDR